jgi:hypothetical protein
MTLNALRLAERPAAPQLRRHSAPQRISLLYRALPPFLVAFGFAGAAVAQAPGASQAQPQFQVAQLACPRGTQILVLLQGSSVPADVKVLEPNTGRRLGEPFYRSLDTKTVAPQDMPSTVDLTQIVGEKDDIVVMVMDAVPDQNLDFQSDLKGYIGCGGWQDRMAEGLSNTFLLKRSPPVESRRPPEAATTRNPGQPRPLTGLGIMDNPAIATSRLGSGVSVAEVRENSLAAEAGFMVGDVIDAIGSRPVANSADVNDELDRLWRVASTSVVFHVAQNFMNGTGERSVTVRWRRDDNTTPPVGGSDRR